MADIPSTASSWRLAPSLLAPPTAPPPVLSPHEHALLAFDAALLTTPSPSAAPPPLADPLAVLTSDPAAAVLTLPTTLDPAAPEALAAALASALTPAAATHPALVLDIGIAALSLFVQANYTGPPPPLDADTRTPFFPRSAFAPSPLPAGVVVVADAAMDAASPPADAPGPSTPAAADGEAEAGVDDDDEGGAVPFVPTSVKRLAYAHYDDLWHRAAVRALALDGEDAFEKAYYPAYLLLASTIFLSADVYGAVVAACPSALVWRARAARVHQDALLAPSSTLYAVVVDEAKARLDAFGAVAMADAPPSAEGLAAVSIGVRVAVENALGMMAYDKTTEMRAYLEHALALSGLAIFTRGAKGKRTKFQKFTTTHLYLATSAALPAAPALAAGPLPWIVPNESPVLLEELTFSESIVEDPVALDDVAILLATAELIRATHPVSQLTDEQVRPYPRRVADNSPDGNCWTTTAAALLLKSRVEVRGKRTIERAFKQFQRLVELRFADALAPGAEHPDPRIVQAGPPHTHRLAYVYATPVGPWWALLSELGSIYLSKGLPRAALDCFEPMEAWEEIVECYIAVGSKKRAEGLVKDRLRVDPSPRLWTLLGDLQEAPRHYEKAWLVSGKRFPRAQRAWGALCFKRGEYAAAITHFEAGLAINPIFPAIWFSLGMAAMFSEEWSVASRAFSRAVQLEPEHGEAWANLAAVYQRAGETRKAYHALDRALHVKRESWRMWENFLYLCMQLGELDMAMLALRNTLEYNRERQEGNVDVRVLLALVSAHTSLQAAVAKLADDDESPDAQALVRKAARFETELGDLFTYVTNTVTTDPEVWRAHVAYLKTTDAPPLDIIQSMLKRARAAQKPEWMRTPELFDGVVTASLALATELDEIEDVAAARADTAVLDAIATLRPSILLHLNAVVAKSERFFEDSEPRARLIDVLASLEASTPAPQ